VCEAPWRMLEFVQTETPAGSSRCVCCRVECVLSASLCPAYRQLRLLALSCAARCLSILSDPICGQALLEIEDFVEGRQDRSAFAGASVAFDQTRRARFPKESTVDDDAWNAVYCAIHRRWAASFDESYSTKRWEILHTLLIDATASMGAQESHEQSKLVRDIFGNPFHPVSFNSAWRTDTAVSLARQMYDSREFGAMPILAYALQDAGCEDEHILNHCRDANQPHVRGCWVCDLVLGKA
jgi:hypothetical protein